MLFWKLPFRNWIKWNNRTNKPNSKIDFSLNEQLKIHATPVNVELRFRKLIFKHPSETFSVKNLGILLMKMVCLERHFYQNLLHNKTEG
jgi:hypothetical protein